MAKGAWAQNRRIAFGDGNRVQWDHHSEIILRDNPNVVPPNSPVREQDRWIPFYKGNRLYNRQDSANDRWVWNYDFKAQPGEVFFSDEEKGWGKRVGEGFVLVEPNVPHWKRSSGNKRWAPERWQYVVDKLLREGRDVVQIKFPEMVIGLAKVRPIEVKNFRLAMMAASKAAVVLCCEGGMHHGAAAVGRPAVVLFGSFIPPQVTGYDFHTNIAVGEACGKYVPCKHCEEAMRAIPPEQVLEATHRFLP